ncbi:MAG TPA: DNA polymerase Y family protein [Usitatibacter sp.]|nr:DNA polymerase Y family protein [Usitatibacter sp.]
MLWVALELPALPLQIAERGGHSREPLVIGEGASQRPTVACANAAARAVGIREGQAVAAAKALAGSLRALPRDPAVERETLERLAAWAGQFTPMVSVESQGIALEVESSLRLFGGHAKLTAAVRRGARALGFRVAVGIAPTPLAARLFARAEAQGLAVRGCLAPGELRERLAELPLFLLDWPSKTLAQLADLGVLRVRDVLALPGEGVALRFGPEVAASLERLTGRLADPRIPYAAPPRFRARLELPAETQSVEALVFPLRRLLEELEGALRGRGAGAQHIVLTLRHERGACTHVALDFASPEREADFILTLARERLARLALAAPTVALELAADTLLPCAPRSATWLPGPREQALDRERLLERLAARLGRDRVFGIALGDDHRPESDWRKPGTEPVSRGKEIGVSPRFRPVWLLNRPQRLLAIGGVPSVQGALEILAGPERIEAGWWDGEEVRRDYYVAANARGETFWIYREHRDPGAWYLHGVFA